MDVHNMVLERLTSLAFIGQDFKQPDALGLTRLDNKNTCSYCTRPIAVQPSTYQSLGYVGSNSYGAPITLCMCCQAFFVNNPSVMGIEKPKAPNTSQRWGMLAGSGAFIDLESGKSLLFMPKKSSDKFPEQTVRIAEEQFGITIVNVSGVNKQLEIIAQKQPKGQCIWISNFGRKTDVLIRNLTISPGLDSLIEVNDSEINSSTAATRIINLNAVIQLAQYFQAHAKLKTNFINTASDYVRGKLTPAMMMEAMNSDKLKPLLKAMQLLPIDPHGRLAMLDLAKKLKV